MQKLLSIGEMPSIYHAAQLKLGRLNKFINPAMRIEYVGKLYADTSPFTRIEGATLAEIGTGWVPIVPIGLWLLGAEKILTFDLYRHMQPRLTLAALERFGEVLPELSRRAGVHLDRLEKRYNTIKKIRHFDELMKVCNIHYHAPKDIAQAGLESASVDILYSNLVLEHVTAEALAAIHKEARRFLKPNGAIWHNVDCTDHYATGDGMSKINFLKYSHDVWERIGQNKYVYQNRLRVDDYYALFKEHGFSISNEVVHKSDDIKRDLQRGLWLHPDFRSKPMDVLLTTAFRVVLQKESGV